MILLASQSDSNCRIIAVTNRDFDVGDPVGVGDFLGVIMELAQFVS